jgi:hypothetical protein
MFSYKQDIEMENMKINSKNEYRRNRVINGYEPHRMMEMEYQKALGKKPKNRSMK